MRFKALFFLALSFFAAASASAQIFEPVKWKFTTTILNDKEAEVVASCTIESKWHVYALAVSGDPNVIGPIPTKLKLDESQDFAVKGKPTEGKFITHFDPNFEMDLNYHENSATFRQKISIKSSKAFKVSGVLEYMACNDERCIFPDPELFEVMINPTGEATNEVVPEGVKSDEAVATQAEGIRQPLKWTFSSTKISDTEYELVARAEIAEGYHIYSGVHTSDGPMATEFILAEGQNAQFAASITENPDAVKHYDKDFATDVYTFERVAEFRRRVSVTAGAKEISALIKGQVCAEVCVPFTKDFKIDLTTGVGVEYDPLASAETSTFTNDPLDWAADPKTPYNNCGQEKTDYSLWAIFIFGLIGGLLALLTPCVFPMIPLTVSFFTKGSEGNKGKGRAITYGFFILLIYFILSLPFHLSKNVDPEVLNTIATNVWLNAGFFVVFVVFAISFFGYFEITLPSGLANKVDSASNIGGAIGIFFMALTLAIVSFSCTGPILGTVIGSIYSGEQGLVHLLGMELSLPAAKVSAAMTGFGISLGLPFGIFAAFPSLLKKLPKSGGWLQDFKVSLGFVELAFALKFISNSDLVEQWGLIKREAFFAIWILIGVLWALYLLKRFTFKKGYLSTTPVKGFKLVLTSLVVIFTIRLIPGVLPASEYNRFEFLSGFPPPRSYTLYHYEEEFKIYKDLAEAMEVAKAEGKPLFVDFTGWACVNCRKMEETMWPKDAVKDLLDNRFVMVSLYVDENVELPLSEQYIYETKDGRKKQIKTVGNKWATLQTQTFENNSQPMYAILSADSTILAPIQQYETDETKYLDWLNCGISSFESWSQEFASTSDPK